MTSLFGDNTRRAAGAARACGALLTLLASTAIVSIPGTIAPASAEQAATIAYSIPAGALGGAVSRFADASNLQVLYPANLVRGKRSPGVSGAMTREQALSKLLAGSGLSFRFTNADTVTLIDTKTATAGAAAAPAGTIPLDTIDVQGKGESAFGPVNGIIATRSASATRTDTPIIETPQTVSVVGGDQMKQQGSQTVGEALRYTPGVVTGTAGGQADRHDSYFVRGEGGFSAAAQYATTLDGMRWRFTDRTTAQFDTWMLDRVEVVKGPSSALFGAGTPGGLVNLVSKRPSFEQQNTIFTELGAYDSYGTGVDLTGPINNQFAYRLIGLGRTEGNGVDWQRGERVLFAPSLTWAPTNATAVTLSGFYQHDPNALDAGFAPPYGSVLVIPGYGRLPASFWQGDPSWSEYNRTEASAAIEVQHRFNDIWRIDGKFRYGRLESDTKSLDFNSMIDATTMSRLIYQVRHDNTMVNSDVFAEGKFSTGALRHTLLLGSDFQDLMGGHKDGWDRTQYPTLDIFNPIRNVEVNPFSLFRSFNQPFQDVGVYAQDQAAVGNWRFMGGLRYDYVDATSSTYVTLNGLSTDASSTDSAVTGRVGAVYLFDNGLAPFVSYGTSFNPQPAYKYDGSMLKPYTGGQFEGGLRYLSPDTTLFGSLTGFIGTKNGVGAQATCDFSTASPLDRCYTDDTHADVKGVELEARAQLASGLDLIGAATLQKVRWTDYAGQSVDLHVVGVPDVTAALWLNYKAPPGQFGGGWSVGGGVRYIGPTYATDYNVWGATEYVYAGLPSTVPAYAVVDAAIGYDFSALNPKLKGLNARLNVTNLFDKTYVAACNGYGTCSYGKRREIMLRMAYTW